MLPLLLTGVLITQEADCNVSNVTLLQRLSNIQIYNAMSYRIPNTISAYQLVTRDSTVVLYVRKHLIIRNRNVSKQRYLDGKWPDCFEIRRPYRQDWYAAVAVIRHCCTIGTFFNSKFMCATEIELICIYVSSQTKYTNKGHIVDERSLSTLRVTRVLAITIHHVVMKNRHWILQKLLYNRFIILNIIYRVILTSVWDTCRSNLKLRKDTPWSVFSKYFGGKRPCYKAVLLLQRCVL